jgi:hypothetical protein
MAVLLPPGPDSTAPLEVRLQYLRRRRRDPRAVLVVAAIVAATMYALLIGLGLFLR